MRMEAHQLSMHHLSVCPFRDILFLPYACYNLETPGQIMIFYSYVHRNKVFQSKGFGHPYFKAKDIAGGLRSQCYILILFPFHISLPLGLLIILFH